MKACKIITAVLLGNALLFFIGFSSGLAAEKPKPGGTFVVGIHADPDTLNPVIAPRCHIENSIGKHIQQIDLCGSKWELSW